MRELFRLRSRSDLRDLYQEVILDHGRQPRNFGALEGASGEADGYNPLCGDKIHVYVASTATSSRRVVRGRRLRDLAGLGLADDRGRQGQDHRRGRAPCSTASTRWSPASGDASEAAELGKLAVFAGVREFPARVKCATLAWHTLRAALAGRDTAVTTE